MSSVAAITQTPFFLPPFQTHTLNKSDFRVFATVIRRLRAPRRPRLLTPLNYSCVVQDLLLALAVSVFCSITRWILNMGLGNQATVYSPLLGYNFLRIVRVYFLASGCEALGQNYPPTSRTRIAWCMSRDAEARRLYLALCSLQRDEFWDSTWHFPQTGKNGFGSVSFLQGSGRRGCGVEVGGGDWVMLMPGEGAILWFSVRQWPIVVVAPHWSPWDRSSAEGIHSSGELLSLETPRFLILFFSPMWKHTWWLSAIFILLQRTSLIAWLPSVASAPRCNRISRGPFYSRSAIAKKINSGSRLYLFSSSWQQNRIKRAAVQNNGVQQSSVP